MKRLAVFLALALLGPVAPARADLPPPDPAAGVAAEDYKIGALDELDMEVFGEKELSQTLAVDASGHISPPLIGDMIAAGKTPEQLSKELAAKLGEKYLQSPQVSITVRKANSQKIIVEGEVGAPGVYPITGRTTLLQAVALARGANQWADYKRISVYRFVNRQRYSADYNLDAIRKGKAPDPEVFGNDIVVVQRSGVKSGIRDYIQPLSTLMWFIPHP